jgi:hypothetical protein
MAILPAVPWSAAARRRATVAVSGRPAASANSRARSTIGAVPCALRSIRLRCSPRNWIPNQGVGRRRTPPPPRARGTGGAGRPWTTRRSGCSAARSPCSRRKSKKIAASSRASSSGCSIQRTNQRTNPVLPGAQWHPPGRVGGHHLAGTAGRPQRSKVAASRSARPRTSRRLPAGGRRPAPGRGPGRCAGCFPARAAAEDTQRIRARRRPERRLGVARSSDVERIVGKPGDLAGRAAGTD